MKQDATHTNKTSSGRRLISLMLIGFVGLISVGCAQDAEVTPASKSCAAPKAKAEAKPPKVKTSDIPKPRLGGWWFKRQGEHIDQMAKGKYDVLMVGDSITQNWETQGKEVWEKEIKPLNAINLGFGGDRTENVLWRLDHLPKQKTSPKVAVVMVGTNNICWGSDTPRHAAEGVAAIAAKLRKIYPEMKVLVLGVFPRREKVTHKHRKQIIELNGYLPELLKGMDGVTFKDIGPSFLDDKGYLSRKMMPDTTHPSPEGHQVWADAMVPILKKMLAE